jgi:regulator of cell morphogenesis and NO signaling
VTVQVMSLEMPVGQVVLDYPQTRPLLEKLRIDYHCSGRRSLRQAAQNAGMDPESILSQIEGQLHHNPLVPNLQEIALSDLCCYLVNVHHAREKEVIPNQKCLLCKVRQSAPRPHAAMLKRLGDTFETLAEGLFNHMARQEQDLFPLIARMEGFAAGRAPRPKTPLAALQTAILQLKRLHSSTAGSLAQIRDLTEDFSWPDRSQTSVELLYGSLTELEDDLHEHIHYENNCLFPRALLLAKSVKID